MKVNISKKLIALILVGTTLCLTKSEIEDTKATINSNDIKNINEEELPVVELNLNFNNVELEEESVSIDPNSIGYYAYDMDYVEASKNTDIIDYDGNRLGTLVEGRSVPLLEDFDETRYLVNYYGKYAYISKSDAFTTTKPAFQIDMIAKGYVENDTPIYTSYDLAEEKCVLNSLEFVEIYKELDDCYLVQTIDTEGYVRKSDVTLLEGTLAVVDRSNQEMRFYEGNDMTVITPVVTGTKDTENESDLGLFEVGNQAENLYIVPGAWVDTVDYYNGGEGIHTAGWRTDDQFGGDTYLTNGSHGCINTPHDEAVYIHEHIESGDKVLVKE